MLKITRGELGSGKIYAPCEFDGLSQNCFVDTGSTLSAVADHEKFSAHEATGKIRFKSASGIPKEVDEITIETLRVDSSTLRKVKVARLDSQEGFESVIGINVLNEKPFAFRFRPEPSLILDAIAPRRLAGGLQVLDQSLLSIPAKIGGITVRGLWDTGAGLTAVDLEYVRSHPEDFTFVEEISNGVDGTGNSVSMQLYKAKRITVGPHVFQNENVLAIDFGVVREHIAKDISLIIGFNLITKANWFFDLQQGLWAAE